MHICGMGSAPFTDETMPAEVGRRLVELMGCCIGAAEEGPSGCTCWEEDYDLVQQPLDYDAPGAVRSEACEDCAYRAVSPERAGDDRFVGSGPGELEAIAAGATFFCHVGIRRAVRYRHPSGITIDAPLPAAHYVPVFLDGVPYKADGTPADKCAGWAARAVVLGRSPDEL